MKYSFSILLLLPLFITAQVNRYNFDQVNNIKVFENGDSLINAWAGGMNYMQFVKFDLNGDTDEDLLAFDRTGNRLMPFLVETNNGSKRYKYAPTYVDSFPEINHWLVMVDYNCDGRKDLFTTAIGGIGVYKNEGNFKFTWALPSNNLRSFYPPNNTIKQNLYVSVVDYPVIKDIDNDGDIDILTFGQGNTVQHHEGLDSCGLNFKVKYYCWGGFEEDGITNKLNLDACNGQKKEPEIVNPNKVQHTGSTIVLIDLTGNGLYDAVIGDAGFAEVTTVFNDGKIDSAHMYSQDTLYPSYDVPIIQYIYPGFYYEDIDFDGKKDLLSSPSTIGSENVNSVWYYKDVSPNNIPDFELTDSAFLQGQMPDFGEGAYPILADINFDLKLDLFAANFGIFQNGGTYKSTVSHYKNTGTSQKPEFTLITKDFANLSTYSLGNALYPAFADLDNDVDLDMMVGTEDGVLHYFEADYSSGSAVYTLKTPNYNGIDVGGFSTPTFFDIDKDGDLDLFIGNSFGDIAYYKNNGTTQAPSFVFVTDNFGSVNVKSIYSYLGYSVPVFIEDNGNTNLFVGSFDRGVLQFDSIEKVLSLPSKINADFDAGNTPSPDHKISILGLTQKAGKNQFLFTANELTAKGFVYGNINQLSFNVLNSSLPNVAFDGLRVSLKNVSKDSLTAFIDNTTQAYYNITVLSGGWVNLAFQTPFLWDGESNLLVEFCFKNQFSNAKDAIIECEDVGFSAHVFADGTGSINGTSGCKLPFAGKTHLRPNMKFELTPAFVETDQIILDGERNSAAFADLNNDGFLDAIAGNYSGGLTYYKGKQFNDIGFEENNIAYIAFKAYPNPAKNYFTLEWTEANIKEVDIEIFDVTGRQIFKGKLKNNQRINTANLTNGLYIVNATHKNIVVAQFKITVMHD